MVLRETTFLVGGGLTIGLGIALGVGLAWAGAGLLYFDAWIAAGVAVGFGAFFMYVGRAEGADRRQQLARLESDTPADDRTGPP
jgi:hypothetical protein